MCGHMLVFVICIDVVFVRHITNDGSSDSLPCQSADSSWYIWVLFFFVVLFDQSEELTSQCLFFLPLFLQPLTFTSRVVNGIASPRFFIQMDRNIFV